MKLLIFLILVAIGCSSLYSCIQNTFTQSCKSLLYLCLNDPSCAYQIDMNARHIKLDSKSVHFPSLYLSNPDAIKLYNCMKNNCQLPEIDQ